MLFFSFSDNGASTLKRNQNSGNSTHELLQENDLVAVDYREVAEIEHYLKARTFSRQVGSFLPFSLHN